MKMKSTVRTWDSESIMKEVKSREGIWSIIVNCVGASDEELDEINEFIKNYRHIEVVTHE